jgi:hypothetical protein
MSYDAKFSATAQAQLEEYLGQFEHDATLYLSALNQIQAEISKLADNPRLGVTRPTPIPRPTYLFTIRVDDIVRTLRVVFSHGEDEKTLNILLFITDVPF